MTMRLFAQLTKVDAEKRLVYGRACQEVLDHSGEVFDYEKSKPYFQTWSDGIAKDTDGKSLGNLRAMHGKVSAGKITHVDYNDADKAIDIAAKIVDDNEWNKVIEGCYTGFSIGGSYVGERTAVKIDGKDASRYVANPTEISIVDQPCVPTAKFFDVVKADGVIEKVAFKDPPIEVTGTDEEVRQFGEAMNVAKLTMADAIALVKAAGAKVEPHALIKACNEFLAADAALAKSADDETLKLAKGASMQRVHDMIGELGAKCAPAKAIETTDLQKLTEGLAAANAEIEKLKNQPVPYVTLRAIAKAADPDAGKVDVAKISIDTLTKDDHVINADGSIDWATSLHQKRERALIAASRAA